MSDVSLLMKPMQDALRPAGVQADHIGSLWNLTLGLCTLVFVVILAACLYAVWRAPRAGVDTRAGRA